MISDIRLQNFRTYKDDSFEFSPGVNIIVGPNATGKTSLLEAILVVSQGHSYRGSDQELIRFQQPWLRVEAHSNNTERIVKITSESDDKTNKSFVINTQKMTRLSLQKTLPVVVFEPNHLNLLIGSPDIRRNFIDGILEQTEPGYKTLKSQYKRTLAQRNNLLKKISNPGDQLFVWNVRLSELAGQLVKKRIALINKINQTVEPIHSEISRTDHKLAINYHTSCDLGNYESDLLKKLELSLGDDLVRGYTSRGPHRDDIRILINGRLASDTASRGETRTIVLSLKVIEAQIVENARDQSPILLFDDVFSELDGSRRLALTSLLNKHQTYITTTDADVTIEHFSEKAKIIPTTYRTS